MTLTQREQIDQIKRELRSYNYYQKVISKMERELTQISTELNGVRSPSLTEQSGHGGFNSGAKSDRWYALIKKKNITQNQMRMYKNRLKRLENMLSLLEGEELEIIQELYIQKKSFQEVAIIHSYSVATLYRTVDRIITMRIISR